jgi:hypothetical protein
MEPTERFHLDFKGEKGSDACSINTAAAFGYYRIEKRMKLPFSKLTFPNYFERSKADTYLLLNLETCLFTGTCKFSLLYLLFNYYTHYSFKLIRYFISVIDIYLTR